jgi:hypothetical protein
MFLWDLSAAVDDDDYLFLSKVLVLISKKVQLYAF